MSTTHDPFGNDIIPFREIKIFAKLPSVINQMEDGGGYQTRPDTLGDFGNLGGVNGSSFGPTASGFSSFFGDRLGGLRRYRSGRWKSSLHIIFLLYGIHLTLGLQFFFLLLSLPLVWLLLFDGSSCFTKRGTNFGEERLLQGSLISIVLLHRTRLVLVFVGPFDRGSDDLGRLSGFHRVSGMRRIAVGKW